MIHTCFIKGHDNLKDFIKSKNAVMPYAQNSLKIQKEMLSHRTKPQRRRRRIEEEDRILSRYRTSVVLSHRTKLKKKKKSGSRYRTSAKSQDKTEEEEVCELPDINLKEHLSRELPDIPMDKHYSFLPTLESTLSDQTIIL